MQDIHHPHSKAPEFGTLKMLAPGVYWLRMPLPMALDHINLYMLEDDDGWIIIDTGIKCERIRGYWEQIFAEALGGKPVKAVWVTHLHPDHVGQAGWLCERWQVGLSMSYAEYLMARAMSSLPSELIWSTEQYMRRHGASESRIEAARSGQFNVQDILEPIPAAFQRLKRGDTLEVAGQLWEVIIGGGHSPEHVCFYCASLGVLLAGDQIIARITPNVSVWPVEPEGNPMAEFLGALPQFYDLPDDTLVCPAHQLPFTGLHRRVSEMLEHHDVRLRALEHACQEEQTSIELLPVIFSRELDENTVGMAQGECLAHLHYLMYDGKIERRLADDGVYRYRSTRTDTGAAGIPRVKDSAPPMQV